jgi:hypothetical protein
MMIQYRSRIWWWKISRITILRLYTLHWPMVMIWPKSQKFKIGYDGILSIGNFILMIKNQIPILIFDAATQWLTSNQKMCSLFPWQHRISYLLEHIFKKMGSTEIVVSSVRLSVCPSVRAPYFHGNTEFLIYYYYYYWFIKTPNRSFSCSSCSYQSALEYTFI